MATKKVAVRGTGTAASHDRNPRDLPQTGLTPAVQYQGKPLAQAIADGAVAPHKQPKPAAKKPAQATSVVPAQATRQLTPAVKKPAAKVERKQSLQTVQNGLSSRKETEKTVPYVLLRKPTKPGGKVTRQIINLISVSDTADASHVRPMRVCTVGGDTFGTNLGLNGISLRAARFFDYGRGIHHSKSAKTVQPWDLNNDNVVRALEKLGAITKFELEFHLEEAARRRSAFETAQLDKVAREQRVAALSNLKKATREAVRKFGAPLVRTALKTAAPALF